MATTFGLALGVALLLAVLTACVWPAPQLSLEQAQEQVGFAIVEPRYLPPGLDTRPQVEVRRRGGAVALRLKYQPIAPGSTRSVDIIEYRAASREEGLTGRGDVEYVQGVEVLVRQDGRQTSMEWLHRGLHFFMVADFEYEKARWILESMLD